MRYTSAEETRPVPWVLKLGPSRSSLATIWRRTGGRQALLVRAVAEVTDERRRSLQYSGLQQPYRRVSSVTAVDSTSLLSLRPAQLWNRCVQL